MYSGHDDGNRQSIERQDFHQNMSLSGNSDSSNRATFPTRMATASPCAPENNFGWTVNVVQQVIVSAL
jgi:hypothetical protein